MKPCLLGVQLTLLCALSASGEVQPQKDFDLQKFAGRWYRVGLAYDSPAFAPFRHMLRISKGILTPMENGNVNVTMWGARSSGCRSRMYMYEKTAVPGQFTYFSTSHNRVKDITIVETNYDEYALVMKHKKMDKEYSQVALYGRTERLRPELLEKFREFALAQGFSPESILTPPPTEDCPPGGI